MDQPTYVTQEGLEKLQADYKKLKEVTIPEIAAKIDEAKQLGDLSENAEYHSAKEDMSWAQTSALQLEEKLRDAQIIQQTGGKDTVEIGCTVIAQTGEVEKAFTIVGPPEADPPSGKISNESPLGQAFLGKKVGEEVDVEVPHGVRKYVSEGDNVITFTPDKTGTHR